MSASSKTLTLKTCAVCGSSEKLYLCARCRSKLYCSREHQKADWRQHKKQCAQLAAAPKDKLMPAEGSSESEILNSVPQVLSPHLDLAKGRKQERPAMPKKMDKGAYQNESQCNGIEERDEDFLSRMLVQDMNEYGVCVVDNFLGEARGRSVLKEVLAMYNTNGVFKDGQLVSSKGSSDLKTIRGDQITWIDGTERCCENIRHLINQVDVLVMKANKMANNGKLGMYNIDSRTKAMVACYPGSGSHYVKHVDNPNRDGRIITAIYYLNLDWNVQKSGGLLRIFPEGWLGDKVADIEPLFDRLLFFWSDRRNPHEVQPAYDTRYAITLWYFDANERKTARERFEAESKARLLREKS